MELAAVPCREQSPPRPKELVRVCYVVYVMLLFRVHNIKYSARSFAGTHTKTPNGQHANSSCAGPAVVGLMDCIINLTPQRSERCVFCVLLAVRSHLPAN